MSNTFLRILGIVCFISYTGRPLLAQHQPLVVYSLHKALVTARSNNLVLKTQYYDVLSGQADMINARLRPNPALNNQTLQLVNSKSFYDNTSWSNARNRQVWWQLTKPIQLPAQRKYKIEVAGKNYELLNKNFAEVERNLLFNVANAWLRVWTIEKQREVIQVAKVNTDTLVRINEVKLKNQVISQTDLLRTKLLAERYQIQLRTIRQNLRDARNDLRLLLGVNDSLKIDTADTFMPPTAVRFDTLLVYALQHRADLQYAHTAVDASASNIKLQRSMAWPQPELGVIWNPQNTVRYAGFFGTIELPIFSRNQGEIQRSTIQKQQAEQSITAIEAQITTEITTAYNSFVTQQQNVERFGDILVQSQTILDNVRYAYLRGGTTIIDFLEAQQSWLDTQQQYFDALQQYQQSYIELLFVSGQINALAQ